MARKTKTTTTTLEQVSSVLKLAESKKHELSRAFQDLQSQTSSAFSLTVQWQDLQSHFDAIEASLKNRIQELESKEKELAIKEQSVEAQTKKIEAREHKRLEDSNLKVDTEPVDYDDRDADLRFSVSMDGKAFQLFLNERVDVLEKSGDEVLRVIKLSSDPAKLVLDAMEGFYPLQRPENGGKEFELGVVRRSCVLLLEQLLRASPLIRPNVRDDAKRVVSEWKGKMGVEEMEVLGVLLLVGVYGLVPEFDKDEIAMLFGVVVKNRLASELRRVLGITDSVAASEFDRIAWTPPLDDFVKVNFDGSFIRQDQLGGLGAVVRDKNGKVIAARARKILGVLKSNVVELLAAKEALDFVSSLGFNKIVVEGDCLSVINLLLGKTKPKNDEDAIALDAFCLASRFTSCLFSYVKRKGNKVADRLSKFATKVDSVEEWKEDVPSWLSISSKLDIQGIAENRATMQFDFPGTQASMSDFSGNVDDQQYQRPGTQASMSDFLGNVDDRQYSQTKSMARKTTTTPSEQISSDLKLAESKKHELSRAFQDLQSFSSSIFTLTVQWQDLQSDFDAIEASLKNGIQELESKEKEIAPKVQSVEARIKNLEAREGEFAVRSSKLEDSEREFAVQFGKLEDSEREFAIRSNKLEDCKRRVKSLEKEVARKEQSVKARIKNVEAIKSEFAIRFGKLEDSEREFEVRSSNLEDIERQVKSLEKEVAQKKQSVEARIKNVEARKSEFAIRFGKLEDSEREFAVRSSKLEARERRVKSLEKEVARKEHSVEAQTKKFEAREREFAVRFSKLVLNERIDVLEKSGDVILAMIKMSSDPAKLVLDAMGGFYPLPKNGGKEFKLGVVRSSCVLLLEQLLRASPPIRQNVREDAKRIAREWKGKMGVEELEVLGFLLLVGVYELVPEFDKDKIVKLFGVVAKHRLASELRRVLGITDSVAAPHLDGFFKGGWIGNLVLFCRYVFLLYLALALLGLVHIFLS